MERLTQRYENDVFIVGCKTFYSSEERKKAPASSAIARLAKYEDTDLAPDEIETLIAERAALLEALHGSCRDCIYAESEVYKGPCRDCYFCEIYFNEPPNADSGLSDNWQWKGIGDNG